MTMVANLLAHLIGMEQEADLQLLKVLQDVLLQLLWILDQVQVQLHGEEYQLLLQVTHITKAGGSTR